MLDQCTAEQLDRIEHYNPYVKHETDSLWQTLCTDKYPELRTLHEHIENGTLDGVVWREQYWAMRRKTEERAQQIMQRVRNKTAEVERERSARRVKVARPRVRTPGRVARGASLMQEAWVKTRAHMQMLEPPRAAREEYSPASRDRTMIQQCASRVQSRQGSPAQSPPHVSCSPPYSSSSPSYSPPHSSYSPPHSSYSPPHVPDSAAYGRNSYSPKFSVVESPASVNAQATTPRKQPPAKRRRPVDGSGPRHNVDSGTPPHGLRKRPRPSTAADRRSQMLP
ncbi:hypothetical protein IWW56_005364 [Coemansia sp. RSA 2131]|nr:hypothetical protein IWW56_005364 [Coemansia sp. RSA 2131]